MAVTNTSSETPYVGDGATVAFPTVFRFLEAGDLTVTVTPSAGGTPVVQTLGVHYNVAGEGLDAGGTVTFLAAPAAGDVVTIERNTPITQDVHFALQGDFFPETHEEAFDKETMVAQEIERRVTALENSATTNNAVAGNGLGVAGSTWNVGAGAGIQANADDIEVIFGDDPAKLSEVYAGAADAGVRDEAARVDHKHDVKTDVPGSIAIGDTANEGASERLARADHRHELAPPGAPQSVGTANAAGGAPEPARADHVHAHGAQPLGAGTDHAMGTTATAGFIAPDFVQQLSNLRSFFRGDGVFFGNVATADATPTVALSIPIGATRAMIIAAWVIARDATTPDQAGFLIVATFDGNGGVAVQIGATTTVASHKSGGAAAWAAGFDVNANTARVKVTGAAGKNIVWNARVLCLST